MNPILAIVGQPNVGKSTFFNRLVGYRKAIIHSESGVTRDKNYGISDWNGINFSVIDTGGYINISNNIFEIEIQKQIFIAIQEANLVLFIVDVNSGLTSLDNEIAKLLRSSKKRIFLMINKVDNSKLLNHAFEFFALGFDKYYCVSSINGFGTGELLDDITNFFKNHLYIKTNKYQKITKSLPRISLIGQPNVGKSTIINTLLEKQERIVTDLYGTTRDSTDIYYNKFDVQCILTDTAGIRKKYKNNHNVEFYSIQRSIQAIKESDVCLLIIDVLNGWNKQDTNLFNIIKDYQKGIIILINKCDLIKNINVNIYKNIINKKILPFNDLPILFTSSKNKKDLLKAIQLSLKLFKKRNKKIESKIFNKIMLEIVQNTPPKAVAGKIIHITSCLQLPTYTPKFIFFTNYAEHIDASYKRFIEKQIRLNFNFTGIPIKIFFRKK